jgi:3-deoxy-manno-octulosonate cytidylyltransferase (CMP-KDO synthetase)
MKIIGIIPARYASTRFPGKPLAQIQGKSMVQRVYEQAKSARKLEDVWVATDDLRIEEHVLSFGGKVVMTMREHPSGTDRCFEALQKSGIPADAVINIQGDEPFIQPAQIDALADLITKPEVNIATLVKRITDPSLLLDVNKVKVVLDKNNKALYFSRSPIPYFTGVPNELILSKGAFYKHVGIYAYTVETLRTITHLEKSFLEQTESLEQLRWLENGVSIYTALTSFESPAIDTPDDLEKMLKELEAKTAG